MSDTRQQAHRLIDRLPEAQLASLVQFLETIIDPAAAALERAPIDDEPESGDEKAKLVTGRREKLRFLALECAC